MYSACVYLVFVYINLMTGINEYILIINHLYCSFTNKNGILGKARAFVWKRAPFLGDGA